MSQSTAPTDLFAREALAFHAEQNIGRPSLLRPTRSVYITILLCLVIILGISYLATKKYTRKETVSGSLIASVTTKRVYPEIKGLVSAVLVKVGDEVNAGDILVLVRSNLANQLAGGTTSEQEYDLQIKQHEASKKIRQKQHVQNIEHLKAEYEIRTQQLVYLDNQLKSQRAIAFASDSIAKKSEGLYTTGHLSKLEWDRLDERANRARQQLDELEAKKMVTASRRERLSYEENKATAELSAQLLQLDIQVSTLKRNRNRLSRETSQSVIAPISGTVSSIFRGKGEMVSTQHPILSIQPIDTRLEAELFLPGNAIGFVEPGQKVNLLYDAYPYQQFGSYAAQLSSISSHPITAHDTLSILPGAGAFYLAKVIPETATVFAYGEAISLKEGMSLKADIVLDERSLLDWLFEPLLVHQGRTPSP
jgi:membrane fusion protein